MRSGSRVPIEMECATVSEGYTMNGGYRLMSGFVLLATMPIWGCAQAFLGAGDFLSTFGDGLYSIGSCLSPLEPIELNEVFDKAPVVTWTDGMTEITDAAQPDVQAFLDEKLGEDVTPIDYRSLRFQHLGSLSRGEVIRVEAMSDVVYRVALYDADYTLIPAGSLHDFTGQRRALEIPIARDTLASYLRLDLRFLSETNQPMILLTRLGVMSRPEPRGQTVMLNFGGQEDVIFRSGYLIPARVGTIDDPVIRQIAARQFRSVFAPYNLTVLTDADPLPAAPFSAIHIGPAELSTYNYGLAEFIDSRNAYPDDIAVVDTNQPALDIARLLGPETFGRAIGMIAAHEMGHLLGLEHVSDPDALMTGAQCQGTGADIERMLRRQFKRAPIIMAVADLRQWVVGYQDAAAELLEMIGAAGPNGEKPND